MGFYFLSHQSCDVTWQNALICQIDIIDSFEQDWQCDHFLQENLLKFALKMYQNLLYPFIKRMNYNYKIKWDIFLNGDLFLVIIVHILYKIKLSFGS